MDKSIESLSRCNFSTELGSISLEQTFQSEFIFSFDL
jgi:hypothetical protein